MRITYWISAVFLGLVHLGITLGLLQLPEWGTWGLLTATIVVLGVGWGIIIGGGR